MQARSYIAHVSWQTLHEIHSVTCPKDTFRVKWAWARNSTTAPAAVAQELVCFTKALTKRWARIAEEPYSGTHHWLSVALTTAVAATCRRLEVVLLWPTLIQSRRGPS